MKQLITLFMLITSLIFSQDFWEPTNEAFDGKIYALATNLNGDIFAGTNKGKLYRSNDNGDNWDNIFTGNRSIYSIAINAAGHIFVGIGGDGILRSTDNGESWTTKFLRYPDTSSYGGIRALTFDSIGNLYAGSIQGDIYRSNDNADNWSQLNFEISSNYQVRAIEINENGYIFVGTYNGIYCSFDDGNSWDPMYIELLPNQLGYVRALALGSFGQYFAAVDHFVFCSKDGGEIWEEVNFIGGWGVTSLVLNSQGHIIAGGDGYGIHLSTDKGNNWISINSGLDCMFVYSLAINSADQIFVGTLDGIVYRSTHSITSTENDYKLKFVFTLSQNYPNPFNPITTIKYSIPTDLRYEYQDVRLIVYDILGREVATLVNEKQKPGNYEVDFDASTLTSGIYFYRLRVNEFIQSKKMMLAK